MKTSFAFLPLRLLRPSFAHLRVTRTVVTLGVLLACGAGGLRGQDAARDSGDYRIAPRDQLQFQVFEEEESVLLQRVSSAGEISVPLLGAVKVAGLSLRECEALIEKRYREGGYYVNPQVILSFQAYAPRSVSVLGQVNNPNQVDFPIERGGLGLMTAIARAGGFTRVARTDEVRVMRTVEGREVSYTVNVSSYLENKGKGQEFRLLPDDIVFVPERVF